MSLAHWESVRPGIQKWLVRALPVFFSFLYINVKLRLFSFLWFTIHLRIYLHSLYSAARILNCHVDNRPEAKFMNVQFR
jgi:hypothetical protein